MPIFNLENGDPGVGRTLVFSAALSSAEAVLAVGATTTALTWDAAVVDTG
ncbi:hypothetical protein [Acidithiobacillus sp.]|nr:hypothetical protein [Acidithiobacillus sp.]